MSFLCICYKLNKLQQFPKCSWRRNDFRRNLLSRSMLQVWAAYDQQRADFSYKQKLAEQMVGKGQFWIPRLQIAYSVLCITLEIRVQDYGQDARD